MKESNRLRIVAYFLCSVIILACAVLVCDVQVKVGNQDYVVKSILPEEFSSLRFFNSHMETDGNENKIYIPDNDDPQVYLSVPEEKINSVQVNFASGLEEDTVVMLFYCKEGEGFAIENITDVLVPKGGKKAILFMPEEKYAILRLDINGEYSIESIDLGIAKNNGSIYSGFYDFKIVPFVLLFLILILLAIFEKKLKYYSFVKSAIGLLASKIKRIKPIRNVQERYFNTDIPIENDISARRTANCFAALAIIFGLLFIYLVPPSSCPDEHTHIENICRISSGNLFADRCDDKIGSYLKSEEIDFIMQTHQEYSFDSYRDNKYSYFNNYLKFEYQNRPVKFIENGNASINPMAYVSSVVGVVLIKLLFGISNPFHLLIWAKISNLIFSILVIRLSILKTPILRNTMFLLALMPMTIYQYSSVSYDTEAICGSFLLFAYSMRLVLAEDSYRISTSDVIAVCFACACLFAGKIAYAPLIIILLAISIKKFGTIKRYFFSIFLILIVGVVVYVLPTAINNSIAAGIGVANEAVEEQKNFIYANFNLVPTILLKTFTSQKSYWIKSFVGVFGWVRIYLEQPFVTCYFAVLVFIGLVETFSIRKICLAARIFSVSAVSVVIMGMILAMYIGWTPVVSNTKSFYALGVQGRYFIPIAIYSLLWLANPLLCKFKYLEKVNKYMSYISIFLVTAYLFLSSAILLTAYWI